MTDDTQKYVRAAIGEGYAVENDPEGRLRFFMGEDLEILWRQGMWRATSCNGIDARFYSKLETALTTESWLLENNALCL